MWSRAPLLALILLTPALRAEKIDLGRMAPVPAGEPTPTADYFRLPVLGHPVLNETGTHLAALLSSGDNTSLLVWDIARKSPEIVNGFRDTDIADVAWLDTDHVTFGLTSEKYFLYAAMVGRVGALGSAYPIFQYEGAELLGVPPDDPRHPLFWLHGEIIDAGGQIYTRAGPVVEADAFRSARNGLASPDKLKTYSGMEDLLQDNQDHIRQHFPPVPDLASGYLADPNGHLQYGFGTDDNGQTTLYHFKDGAWVKCPVDLNEVDVVACGDAAGQIVVRGPREVGKPRPLRFMDADTGALGRILYQDSSYDCEGSVYRDPNNHQIIGVQFDRELPTRVWFSPAFRSLQHMLDAFFRGRKVQILSTNKAVNMILVSVYSDRDPASYYTVDLAHHQVGLIKSTRPWIDPSRMAPMKILHYRTRDGVILDAYITLPPGASQDHPVPMVVYPHGGPFARDTWEFRGDVQYLASLGYAVLQPNYRNSLGYQWRVSKADEWNFGKMTEDVSDAARAAINTHLVDPKRVAIVGGSFGGYLSISGVAHDPSLYRCAVSIAGVFDWERMIREAKWGQHDYPGYAALKRYLGDPHKDHSRLTAMSPINFVDQIKVPVFIYHGEDDENVPIYQSHLLVSALDRYHVPHETMFVRQEGHGPRHIDAEVAMWERIKTFLAQNLASH